MDAGDALEDDCCDELLLLLLLLLLLFAGADELFCSCLLSVSLFSLPLPGHCLSGRHQGIGKFVPFFQRDEEAADDEAEEDTAEEESGVAVSAVALSGEAP